MTAGKGSSAVVEIVRGGVPVASWSLASLGRPDLSVVNDLARLQLAARRMGLSVQLRNPCTQLCELLAFLGLTDVIAVASPGGADLPLEDRRQAERGEQVRVEEVVQPDEPIT